LKSDSEPIYRAQFAINRHHPESCVGIEASQEEYFRRYYRHRRKLEIRLLTFAVYGRKCKMLSIVKKHISAFVGLFLIVVILVVSATFFTTSHAAAATKTWKLTNPRDPITGKVIGAVRVSTSGTLIFNNRSVLVGGKISASGGCGRVQFVANGANGETFVGNIVRDVCNGTRSFGFTLPANVPGGARDVSVEISSSKDGALNIVDITR
jgi:hypothetical protein